MSDAPDLEPAALEAQFRARFKDGRLAPYPLWDYWVAVDGKTGDLGYEWSDKPHRLVFDLLHHAVALEKALSAARSTVPEAGKAVDDMAAILWRTEAVDVGAPPSVAAGRTRDAFGEQNDATKDTWRKFARAALAALASVVPSGAEPAAWMVLRKGNLHLPVLTSKEDAVRYQQYNPEETLQPLYASPQAVAPTEGIADGPVEIEIDRLRLAAFHSNNPKDIDAYYLAVSKWFQDRHYRALSAEATISDLRRKLEEHRKALEPFSVALKGNLSRQHDNMKIVAGPNSYDLRFTFTLGDFRRARALSEREGQE